MVIKEGVRVSGPVNVGGGGVLFDCGGPLIFRAGAEGGGRCFFGCVN